MITFFIYFLSAFGLDRVTKYIVETNYSNLSHIPMKYYDIVLVKNKGVAFNLLENNPLIVKLITLVFITGAIYYIIKNKTKLRPVSFKFLGVLLGGVLGNFYDRIEYGYVIDFIKLRGIDFPVMNIADIAINVGIIGLILLMATNKEFKDAK